MSLMDIVSTVVSIILIILFFFTILQITNRMANIQTPSCPSQKFVNAEPVWPK